LQQNDVVIPELPTLPEESTLDSLQALQESVRRIMTQDVGILRNGVELELAYAILSEIEDRLLALRNRGNNALPADTNDVRRWGETRNLALVARLVAFAALRREESRGAHFRDDYPQPNSKWRRQQSLTVASLSEAH